jgi:hypothetical protein
MNPTPNRQIWSPERLAYWYFRLNGFLTTENFVIHPDAGGNQRTDADLLAVRFAHRAENLHRPMQDDPRVISCRTFANVIIAEIKIGTCALNGPWTNPREMNMQRILKAIGCVSESAIGMACNSLYGRGVWFDSATTIRLFALGENQDAALPIPPQQQLTWQEIIRFCVKRFIDYGREKSSVGQWSEDGKRLREAALQRGAESEIRRLFGLHANPHENGA